MGKGDFLIGPVPWPVRRGGGTLTGKRDESPKERGCDVGAFWTGFLFDTAGTISMELLEPGMNWTSSHTITGQIALWLMFAHAVWATRVVRTGSPAVRARFHRFSLVVWTIWLVPYIGGMFLGMTR